MGVAGCVKCVASSRAAACGALGIAAGDRCTKPAGHTGPHEGALSAASSRDAAELLESRERMADALWRLWRGGYISLASLDAVGCGKVADAMASAAGEPRRSTETPRFTDHPQDIADQEAANWDNAQEA